MIRAALRRVSFEQIAIAFTVIVIAFLYFLAAGDALRNPKATPDARESMKQPAPATAFLPAKPAAHFAEKLTLLKRVSFSADVIADVYASIGYKLDAVREHGQVPRVFMANLPPDLSGIRAVERRKVMFIKTALPLILHVNELIQHDRQRIEALHALSVAGVAIEAEDTAWLKAKAGEYGLDGVDFDALLRRVDFVPPSLALAQSAEESGWGTSRFAVEGNALFGQRIWRDSDGIVPHRRAEGERFRVAAFDHLIDGVKSYARNLNSHAAYAAFRAARAAQRRSHGMLDGYELAGALSRYSERGAAYVRSIRTIIRANALDVFDRAQLGDRMVTESVAAPDA
jgi:Bax protein